MELQEMPILSVKFKIPEPRKNYVVRRELFQKLNDMDKKKLTIIKAGAGCGKTTLISSFVKEQSVSDLKWITLSDNLNQVFIFWKYIMEVTKEYLGDTTSDFRALYDGNVQKEILWELLTVYLNKMQQEKAILLVLDDFQVIKDEFLLSTINFLISNMPPNLHLVLLTRNIPELYLGTITMEDELLLIEEPEIKLSEEESREFLKHTLDLSADEDKITAMIKNSNGWVGGLQLMAIAAKEQSKGLIANVNTTDRIIGDYITNEIFRYLSEEERDFLKKTSILSYFNRKICEQYLPTYDFDTIMGSILSKNLLVISIDEQDKVYRYHSILKDYLNGLMDQEPQQKRLLHICAAEIFNTFQDYEESICQLFEAQEYELIMNQLLKMPQNALTFSYMMKVPLEVIIGNRDFAYQYFFCYYASNDQEACERIYDMITEHLKDDDTINAFKHVDMFFKFFNVDWKFQDVNVLAIEKIDSLPLNLVTKAYLLIKESYFLFLSDRYQEALKYLDKAQQIYEKTGNNYLGIFILSERSQILEENGELGQALAIYKKMEKFLESSPTLKTSYYIGITGVYIKQFAFSKAREALRLANQSRRGNADNSRHAYLTNLAELSFLVGDLKTAEQIIEELNQSEIYQNIYFSARLMRYAIYSGLHKEYRDLFIKEYNDPSTVQKHMDMDLLYLKILYDNGDITNAMKLSDHMLSKARKNQNKLKIVDLDLMRTRLLLYNKDSEREIINTFIEAVSYAFENNIALPFWFEKDTTATVMKRYQEVLTKRLSGEELEFVKEVLNADKEMGLKPSSGKDYDLTDRECEVLAELKNGCSNKQIADHLCISLATVKSHIINIYSKLGVNNRVAAINKTKEYTEE